MWAPLIAAVCEAPLGRDEQSVPVIGPQQHCISASRRLRLSVPPRNLQPLNWSKRIEICDLRGHNDALVRVKLATGSAPLSHLSNQALFPLRLRPSPWARGGVHPGHREFDGGRLIASETAEKVVLGIQSNQGAPVDVDRLFSLSQVPPASHPARSCTSSIEPNTN
ncbi:DUF6119 family protein [Actinomadura sp. NPDC000600]|uniref:DUF6119 family protein n=1 Tax=Actinomadura sp. NPDC000600 TaxID=3154262 RepID=UPI003399683B